MNGKSFKISIVADGRTKQDIAKAMKIHRTKLNDLEKMEDVPEEYIRAAKEAGVKFNENVATKGIAIPIEALEIAERMTEKVRADYSERISELNRTIEFLMTLVKDKKKVA